MAAPVVLLAGTIISAGAAAYGAVAQQQAYRQQAKAAQQMGEWQAANAREAAQFYRAIGEHNAQAAVQRAAAEEARLRRDRSRRLGAMRAQIGATGAAFEGTPLDVLADQAMSAEEEAMLVRWGGAREAEQERLRAAMLSRNELVSAGASLWQGAASASALRAQGTQSLIGGLGGAGSTLLTGYGNYLNA